MAKTNAKTETVNEYKVKYQQAKTECGTLKKMLEEEGITLKMEGLFAPEADRAMAMVQK